MISAITGRFQTVFVATFGLLLFFVTPNVNTGDAGELITASYFFGVAHPSGYPLYLMLAKAASFLPFGNLGFKVALISALFSALSVSLLYIFVLRLTGSDIAAFASSGFILASYSYLAQSVIAKFYTLNLFLILLLFVIWGLRLLPGDRSEEKQCLLHTYHSSFFILGLIMANHNTGLMMLLPVGCAIWMLKREIYISSENDLKRVVLEPILLFLLGFSVNAYLVIRGGDLPPFNTFHVRTAADFVNMITRQTYGEIGTLSKASTLFSDLPSFWYGLRNFVSILQKNFGIFSFILFVPGCYFVYRKSGRIFIFAMACFLLYGPIFTKIALPGKEVSVIEYYITAHQYFLPVLAFYAFFAGCGMYQVIVWLGIGRRQGILKLFGIGLGFLFLLLFYFRSIDSNYRTDYVPYQAMVDTYAMMPPESYFVAFHDNERYAGRYLKLIGRYREDICHINGLALQHYADGLKTCAASSYANITPRMLGDEMKRLMPLMSEGRLWAGSPGALEYPVLSYAHVIPVSVSYLYLPREWADVSNVQNRDNIRIIIKQRLSVAAKLAGTDVCLGLSADDPLTSYFCAKYDRHIGQMTAYYLTNDYIPMPDEEMWK